MLTNPHWAHPADRKAYRDELRAEVEDGLALRTAKELALRTAKEWEGPARGR